MGFMICLRNILKSSRIGMGGVCSIEGLGKYPYDPESRPS